MIDAINFARIAVDPIRLAVLGAAAVGVVDPAVLAIALGVPERRVLKEAAGLESAGLILHGRLIPEALRAIARSLPHEPAASPLALEGEWTEEEARVLGTFFSGHRLTGIPDKRAKRRVILERLVQEFDPGVRYAEREVNFTLQLFHPDFAALRRYLIDEGLMARESGEYWRTGGRVET